MKQLSGKTVIVTGASSGLGRMLVQKVAQYQGHPILIARSEEKLQKVAREIQSLTQKEIHYFTADVSKIEQVRDTFRQIAEIYPQIDVLINNAGYGVFELFQEAPEESFEKMMQVNYFGAVYCIKQVVNSMISARKGHIINIASQAGKVGTPKSSAYNASKHALLGFTNSLRHELKENNIYVTSINPGPIRTPFFEIADQSGKYTKNIDKYMLDPDYVAERIIDVIIKPKREVNLPFWMELGSRLFHLFPTGMDHFASKFLHKK
ncbi:SDR family NAD(P)-dependent oxidoreductase [Caldalkalibacillus mannanilyticus]|uniref:SDR family NAD(P)-dependent oxidoreductase n=1 Tax=Caldalkalibacillus mannanilyticus TaxID=1418 RepID=UPI000468C31B|nr:SDR family oxidoreductase [Caldalkalibacillus mannanilyticus]